VDIFRINFSFGDAKSHSDEILNLRREAHRSRRELGILQDLPGPKIRIGKMLGGSADISKGHSFILTSKPILGNSHRASINNTQLISFLKPGDIVFIADGIIELRVDKVRDGQANCIVLVGGRLGSGKGVNVPGAKLKIRYPTPEDLGHLEAGKALGVDFIALSFIRTAKDIRSVRDWAKQKSSSLFIIAKIEKREAVANFDSILKESDGVMIARGDLGIEVPIERVPMIQKEIIRKCNASGKPVIVATQMLESMVFSPVPTRAEATDVSTAILDGADALLLSDETAIGRYPIEAIRVLDKIAAVTEPHLPPLHHSTDELRPLSVEEAVGHAAAQLADDIQASAIVAPTQTGLTAIRVARYRPRAPIIAICVDRDIARLQYVLTAISHVG
jgi:pyruvate kinase